MVDKMAGTLARAGGIGGEDAAEILSKTMTQFSLSEADMAHVVEVIAGASRAVTTPRSGGRNG